MISRARMANLTLASTAAIVIVIGTGFMCASEAFMQAPLIPLVTPADLTAVSPHQPTRATTYRAARLGMMLTPMTTNNAYGRALFLGGRGRGPALGTIIAVSSAKRENEEGAARQARKTTGADAIGAGCDFSASVLAATGGGWTFARDFLRATTTATAPLAVTLLFMIASSTSDQDILAAFGGGGLSDDASNAPITSRSQQGQAAAATTTNSASVVDDAGDRGGEAGAGNGVPSGEGRVLQGAVAEGGGGLNLGTDTDLMRSLGGSARQAGPLTHGF